MVGALGFKSKALWIETWLLELLTGFCVTLQIFKRFLEGHRGYASPAVAQVVGVLGLEPNSPRIKTWLLVELLVLDDSS